MKFEKISDLFWRFFFRNEGKGSEELTEMGSTVGGDEADVISVDTDIDGVEGVISNEDDT